MNIQWSDEAEKERFLQEQRMFEYYKKETSQESFYEAAATGHVDYLRAHSSEVDIYWRSPETGLNAFLGAVHNGEAMAAQALMPLYNEDDWSQAFMVAAKRCDIEAMNFFLPHWTVGQRSHDGVTALEMAAEKGGHAGKAAIEWLLRQGAQEEALLDSNDGLTPFMRAAFTREAPAGDDDLACMKALRSISDENASTGDGRTALMFAALRDNGPRVSFLASVSNVLQCDNEGFDAFSLAGNARCWTALDALSPWIEDKERVVAAVAHGGAENMPIAAAWMESQELAQAVEEGRAAAKAADGVDSVDGESAPVAETRRAVRPPRAL